MKYLVTRRRIYFAGVEAADEDIIRRYKETRHTHPEEDWEDDDRPDEFSIECDPVDDEGESLCSD